MRTLRSLPVGEAHVLYVRAAEVNNDLLARCANLLSEDERVREAKFLREEDRRRHRISRVLQRVGLSMYAAEVQPKDWVFVKGKYGRPEISDPTHVDLRFNVSHTPGLVAMVVARCDCGVDAEILDQEILLDDVSRVFSDAERTSLLSLSEPMRTHCLLAHWTLKEAFLKALGLGLSAPPQWVSTGAGFHQGLLGQPIELLLDPRLDEEARRWQLDQGHPVASHIMTVALNRGDSPDLALKYWEVLPSICADDKNVVLARVPPSETIDHQDKRPVVGSLDIEREP